MNTFNGMELDQCMETSELYSHKVRHFPHVCDIVEYFCNMNGQVRMVEETRPGKEVELPGKCVYKRFGSVHKDVEGRLYVHYFCTAYGKGYEELEGEIKRVEKLVTHYTVC